MKKSSLIMTAAFCFILLVAIFAGEKDAAGCKDHQLAPRIQGYYIIGCNSADAVADFDLRSGGTLHVEGKSWAVLYDVLPDAKIKKPTEAGLKAAFGDMMTSQGGSLAAETPGQKWPVYKLAKDGKEYWIVLMVDGGEYFTGSYGVRVIEKK